MIISNIKDENFHTNKNNNFSGNNINLQPPVIKIEEPTDNIEDDQM